MELLFVYNAEKDVLNGLVDYAHKVFIPSTYKCDLCALTYHNMGVRKNWKEFKKKTSANLSFHYIKGFEKEFNESYDYPVVLLRENGENRVVLNNLDLSRFKSAEDLIVQIQEIIKSH